MNIGNNLLGTIKNGTNPITTNKTAKTLYTDFFIIVLQVNIRPLNLKMFLLLLSNYNAFSLDKPLYQNNNT